MTFFKELFPIIEGIDTSIFLTTKNGKVTLSVLPKTEGKLPAITMTGTPEELDEAFIKAIQEPLEKTKGVLQNVEIYQKAVRDLEDSEKKKLEERKKGKSKKEAGKDEPIEETEKEETEPNLFTE